MTKNKKVTSKLKESNPEIKESKLASKQSEKKSVKSVGKSPTRNKTETKHSFKTEKEISEVAVQDDGGNPDTATVEPKVQVSTVDADVSKLDLFNENIWKSLPSDQVNNKFSQYRQLATAKIRDLEDQLQLTLAKTKRKVNTLKAQFQEHKSKWEAERKLLIDQVDQSLKLQSAAEKEVDSAINHLEEYISEQEKLEEAEENQVQQISGLLSPKDNLTPAHSSGEHSPVPQQQQPAAQLPSPEPEQELLRLMQQTDDAKVQEMNARLGTCVSAPPAVDTEPLKVQRRERRKKQVSPINLTKQTSDLASSQKIPVLDVPESDSVVASAVELERSAEPLRSPAQLLEPPSIDLLESYPVVSQGERQPSDSAHKDPLDRRESNLSDVEIQTVASESSDLVMIHKQSTRSSSDGKSKFVLSKSTISSDGGVKIEGATEEEIRTSSAQSRVSLRQQFKAKLGEAKQAAEDRRSKSPAIHLPTQLTIDDELILEDDDEEFDDGPLNEIGTSPPPGFKSSPRLSVISQSDPAAIQRNLNQAFIQKIIKKGLSLLEHPLLREFLRVFQGVMGFKEGIGKIFLDKDLMSAHQIISDLETIAFDDSKKVMPQIMELTENILYILEEITSIVNNALVLEREPLVSALNLSREQTLKSVPPVDQHFSSPGSDIKGGVDMVSRESTNVTENLKLKELQDQYQQLKEEMEQEKKHHQDQLQKNTVVMMELQDTISELQRELSSLGKGPLRTKSDLSSGRGTAVHHKSPSPEASVLFTRLDSERNAKIMRKAVMDDKLNTEKYKEAIAKMDEYVSLPAQRLAHLVKKYIHHQRMKEIEENVKNAATLDDDVYDVLNKMENLQNQRARKWAKQMDQMGSERLKLANVLMETLDTIEQESGIFLIKPMYSYRGRDTKQIFKGKLSRPSKIHRSLTPSKDPGTNTMPAPTPASQYRLVRPEKLYSQQTFNHLSMNDLKFYKGNDSCDTGEVKVTGNGLVVAHSSPKTMWNMQASHSWNLKDGSVNFLNTPRILEMDINRMLIGQNNISSKVPFPQSEDRLINASQNTLRSYVTINRPTAPSGVDYMDRRPSSGSLSSHSSGRKVTVSEKDREIPAVLPISQPLPPISPIPGQDDQHKPVAESDDDEPPKSPPGSSLYQSTNGRDTRHSASRLDRYLSTHSDTEDEG